MTTFKTPLPEKYPLSFMDTYGCDSGEVKINQLIDYLTELTKVVEGKQDNLSQTTADGWEDGVWVGGPDTPTLKEQLLGEIETMQPEGQYFDPFLEGYTQCKKDVEAIIHRIIK